MLTPPDLSSPPRFVRLYQRYRFIALLMALCTISTFWVVDRADNAYRIALTSRRPLVMVNGQIQQLPSGDTLSVDGLSVTEFTNTGSEIQSSAITPTALVGPTSVNDYAPAGFSTARTVRIGVSGGNVTLTGLAGGVAGRIVYLVNLSTDSSVLVLANDNVGSSAPNRFQSFAGTDAKLAGLGSVARLEYDGTSARWRVVSIMSTQSAITTVSAFSTNGLLTSAAGQFGTANSFSGTSAPSAISGTQNNYSPAGIGGATTLRQDLSAAATITGIDPAVNAGGPNLQGRILSVQNISTAFPLTITNEDAGSAAADRFSLPYSANLVIPPGAGVLFRYSTTTARWVLWGDGESTQTVIAGSSLTTTDTGTQNNYAPAGLSSATILRLNHASSLSITGISGGVDGRVLYLSNVGTGSVTLSLESSGSTAANRITGVATGSSVVITQPGYAVLIYDGAQQRWVIESFVSTTFTGAVTFSGGFSTAGNVTFASISHVVVNGSTPSVSACGTGAAIDGSDIAGRVNTGSTNTGCTLTFAITYTTVPKCICSTENTDSTFKCVPSATQLVVTYASNTGNTFDYVCFK